MSGERLPNKNEMPFALRVISFMTAGMLFIIHLQRRDARKNATCPVCLGPTADDGMSPSRDER